MSSHEDPTQTVQLDQGAEQVTTTIAESGLSTVTGALERFHRLDRYVVLEPLGQGGMGSVYEAYDPNLRRRVALKVIRSDALGHDRGRARMLREARAMAQLSHPNVLPVYDVGIEGGQVFIAMEKVDGRTLRDWMKDPHPWTSVLEVFRRAGEGLAAAHAQNLVHRDFKPDNVMLDDAGRVLVLDFGLVAPWATPPESREQREVFDMPVDDAMTRLTGDGLAMGTPAYMAPEQHAGEEVDGRADQFSFCVALYEALYGRRPYSAGTLQTLVVEKRHGPNRPPSRLAPAELEPVVLRGLSPAPDDRWPSLPDLLAALDRVPRRRRRRRVLAMGGALGVAIAAVGWWPRSDPCERIEALPVTSASSPHLVERAASWHARSKAACRAPSEPAVDERVQWCLQELRVELLAAAETDRRVELRPPTACDDAGRLLAWTQPPPRDPEPVLALRDQLVRARATRAAAAELEALVTRARALGDLRLQAEAELAHARALVSDGVRASFEATARAMEAGDAELEARGWLVALEHMATDSDRHPEVVAWRPVVEAVVQRAGADVQLVARLAVVMTGPLRSSGRGDEAIELLQRVQQHPQASTLDPLLRRRVESAISG